MNFAFLLVLNVRELFIIVYLKEAETYFFNFFIKPIPENNRS